jgi:MFS family permease
VKSRARKGVVYRGNLKNTLREEYSAMVAGYGGNMNATGKSILSYELMVLTMAHMLTHVYGRIHLALFPSIRNEFSLSLKQLGLIAAIPPLCQIIIAIPIGLTTDRVGSKKMILLSQVIAIIGGIIASMTFEPVMFIIAVSLFYMNTTIYHSSSYSLLSTLFRKRDISKAIGIQDIGDNFGKAIGPISLSILLGIFALGWRQVYLFWSIPILLGIFGVLTIKVKPAKETIDEPPADYEIAGTETRPRKDTMFNASLVLFIIFISIGALAQRMVGVFIPIYLVDVRGLGENLSSLIYGSGALMGMVGAPLGGFLASRFGEKKWLFTVLSLASASLGLGIAIPFVNAFVILYLFYVFCNTLAMSARSALMARLSPKQKRGLGYSLYFFPGSLMSVIAPLFGASFADIFDLTRTFLIAITISVLGLALLIVGVKVPKHSGKIET